MIDVVIPAFNAAAYLDEAIDSVIAQGDLVARIIVVDDGSSDGTAAVAARRGTPVELLQLVGNGGGGRARNAGIASSGASLVAFLDADDRWLGGKLAAQVQALAAAPQAAFALCRMRNFASPELPLNERAELLATHPDEAEGWAPSALLVRREVFARIGAFAEDLRVGEAIDWFNRAKPLGYVSTALVGVERRLHRNNTTRRTAHDLHDYLQVARRHLERRRAEESR
jgi:glycosyltransferase involved in cell wall biosynthesis